MNNQNISIRTQLASNFMLGMLGAYDIELKNAENIEKLAENLKDFAYLCADKILSENFK